MKKLLLLSFSAILCFSAEHVKAQSHKTKDDYKLKSKHEMITGLVFLGGGVGLVTAGIATYQKGPGSLVLVGVGLLTGIASIPFFIAGAVNKHKANTMAFNFKLEKEPGLTKTGIANIPFPALSFKIALR